LKLEHDYPILPFPVVFYPILILNPDEILKSVLS